MTSFRTVRRLPFAAKDLYAIVANVRAYPQFVPLCTASRVWNERTDDQGRTLFKAQLDVAYPKLLLRESFRSDVVCDPGRLLVTAASAEAPMQHLDSRWRFSATQGGCNVEISIEYEFASRATQFLMTGLFDYAMRKVVTAFEERAQELYGRVVG